MSPSFWIYTLSSIRTIEQSIADYDRYQEILKTTWGANNPSEDDLETLFGVGVIPLVNGKSSKESRLTLKRVSRVFRYIFKDQRDTEVNSSSRKPVTFTTSDWI